MNNRMAMNKKANAILKDKFEGAGITFCEICGSQSFLSFAHRLKRRHMGNVEELSDINTCLLLCIPCHQRQEFDKKLSDEWFKRLRGK